jgi:nitrogenase molybdenum-iron protein beta chain
MAKRFSVVGDALSTLAYTKFLVNDLGLLPETQYVVDATPAEFQAEVRAEFGRLNFENVSPVSFEEDGYLIHEQIRNTNYHGYPLILGSTWEKRLADELSAHFLAVSSPAVERLVIDRSYVGYEGGLRLIEDIYSEVMKRFN